MNAFVKLVERYGREEPVFDMTAFGAALAAELGGTVVNTDGDGRPIGSSVSERDELEVDGVRLWLCVKTWGAGANSKVHVRALSPRMPGLRYTDHPYGSAFKLPEAWVTASREMSAIAADVRRRVIDKAKAPLAKWREHLEAVNVRSEDLVAVADRFRKMGLTVRLDEGATRSGTFYKYDGSTVSGEFYPDGSVSMRHVNVKPEAFERLVAAIFNGEGGVT